VDPTGPLPVAAALAPYLTRLVAYDAVGDPGIHRGLPSTGLTVVFPVDVPLDVTWTPDDAPNRAWSTVSGLHTRPARIRHDGHQRGIQLTVSVAGARALFGLPAAALSEQILTVDDLTGAWHNLPERLHDTPTWSARSQLVQDVLAAELARRDTPTLRAEVGRALARLTVGAPVATVAGDVGFSRRRLATVVRDETGVTPKQYARLARFERSKALLVGRVREAGPSTLADVAAAAGFADHAHLSREWTDLAGCAPTRWLAEEFPNVQARDSGPG